VAKIIDKDKGLKRIVANIKELSDYSIKMGVLGNQMVEGVSVVDYAIYNEWGTSRIPARPFMGTTYDRYADELIVRAKHLAGEMIEGRMKPKQVVDTLGLWYVSKIKMTIREAKSWAVPNAASTINLKGSSSPLIDNGRMLNAVNFEVTKT
jgi:HK97 gp10 family phage protein